MTRAQRTEAGWGEMTVPVGLGAVAKDSGFLSWSGEVTLSRRVAAFDLHVQNPAVVGVRCRSFRYSCF